MAAPLMADCCPNCPHLNCLQLHGLLTAKEVNPREILLDVNVGLVGCPAHRLLHHSQTLGKLTPLLIQIQQL